MLPTVAEVLALEPVRRGAPKVLAAADRLDAPVRWVHVIELAEAGHLLKGNELVLSTGIALPPDPGGLARYVAGLASAGVSALAVELGSRYVRELPRALVEAAEEHRLPLIVLEREAQFVAITEAVHTQILETQVAELRASQRLHQVFTDLAVAGAGQDDIIREASALAGAPVILEDRAHRVLAAAACGQDLESLLAGFAGRSRTVTVPRRTGYDQASGWLVAAVGAHGVDWGRLIVVLSGPPRPADTVLVERAATTLALASLVRDRPDQGPERIAHRSVLAALAGTEYADPFDLQARITALGVPLAGHALIPLVICPDARARSAAEVADLLSAACRELGVPAITGVLGEQRAAALLSVPPGFDQDDVLTRLAARLRGDSGESGPVIGVGPMVASLAEAASALRDATAAAGAAERYGSDRPFVRLADLRLAGLLYQLRDDPRLLAFAERELGPLLVHDERAGTRLVQVLASYLEAGGNKAETAQRAGLARPTLYERLREIEQILGIPLDDAASRLALHAALLVERASRRTPSA